MRAVVQRVSSASVSVGGRRSAAVGAGLLVLVGVAEADTERDAAALADKVVGLRVFSDDDGLMNRSLADVGGSVLVVSQFTLIADVTKGRRPSFVASAGPAHASHLVDIVASQIAAAGIPVESGVFGAHMHVELVNDGPVTVVIDVEGGKVR